MADWLYTLEVKDLLASDKGEGFDYDAHAIQIAPTIRDRIRQLAEGATKNEASPKYRDRQGESFAEELYDVSNLFDEVADANPEHCRDGASAMLNDALSELYDLGDSGHRIWIK